MLPHDRTQQPEPAELPDSPMQTSSQIPVGPLPAHRIRIKQSRLWICILGAGLVAGLIAWGIGEAMYGLFQWNDASDVLRAYPAELKKLGPNEQREFITKRMIEARSRAESRQYGDRLRSARCSPRPGTGPCRRIGDGLEPIGSAGWVDWFRAGWITGRRDGLPSGPALLQVFFPDLRLGSAFGHSCRTAAPAGCRLWVCARDRPGWTADGPPRHAVGSHGRSYCRPCL